MDTAKPKHSSDKHCENQVQAALKQSFLQTRLDYPRKMK